MPISFLFPSFLHRLQSSHFPKVLVYIFWITATARVHITVRLFFDFSLIERNDNEVDSIKSLPEVDVKTEETISSSADIENEGFAEELYYCGFCDSTQPSVAVRWCMFCQIMICEDHKKV